MTDVQRIGSAGYGLWLALQAGDKLAAAQYLKTIRRALTSSERGGSQ